MCCRGLAETEAHVLQSLWLQCEMILARFSGRCMKPEAFLCFEQGYGRLGAAFHGLGMLDKAKDAYQKGLAVEPGVHL